MEQPIRINDEDTDEKENEFIPPTLQPPPRIRKRRGARPKKAPQAQNKPRNEFKTFTAAELNKKNRKGETPLQAACNKRNEDLVRHLLGQGASANTQDNNGLTPLHEVAPYSSCFSIVKLLLEHG